MNHKKIGISILNSDIFRIAEELESIRAAGIRNIHVDIMDTSFTENISFGPALVNRILEHDFVFDIHLMLSNPLPILGHLNLENVEMVVVHAEIAYLDEVVQECRSYGVEVGLALNPETPLDVIGRICPNFVLVMCVKPGFGGQTFKKDCVQKIYPLKQKGVLVGVDGGICAETIALARDSDYFVVGSAFFRSEDRKTLIQDLYRALG